jgi:hypothetical protein
MECVLALLMFFIVGGALYVLTNKNRCPQCHSRMYLDYPYGSHSRTCGSCGWRDNNEVDD